MQVDPANVSLPTPSTDSSMLPPDQPMPASPRTCAFVKHLQGQIVHQATTGERGRTTTRVSQDLCNALADMFGLPPLPIPQPPPARSPSPIAAISTSQSCCNESCHSPSVPSISATGPHLPEPEPVLRSSGLKVRRAQVTLRRVEWLKSLEYPKTELKSGKVMKLLW